jgi:hypothetical protein
MRNLADDQVDFIREDIRRRGVFTESLQESLLDHLCCFIEEQPEDRPFGEVYRLALEAFGHNGLQEVQDETLFLINQPYLETMKKIMYISGAIASLALIGGAFFKVNHWPGANIMLILGTLALTFLFFPAFFYMQFKEQTEKRGKIVSAVGFATAVMMCVGALFKIMHWPGAIVMIGGFVLLFVVFLPLYVINGMRNPLTRISSLSNGFLFACIGGFLLLLSFQNPSLNVLQSYKTINDDEKALLVQLQHSWKQSATGKPVECEEALKKFTAECDAAAAALPLSETQNGISLGGVVNPSELAAFQQKIDQAITALNSSLSAGMKAGNAIWKEIPKMQFIAAPAGNLQFQLLQLECRVYLQAISR